MTFGHWAKQRGYIHANMPAHSAQHGSSSARVVVVIALLGSVGILLAARSVTLGRAASDSGGGGLHVAVAGAGNSLRTVIPSRSRQTPAVRSRSPQVAKTIAPAALRASRGDPRTVDAMALPPFRFGGAAPMHTFPPLTEEARRQIADAQTGPQPECPSPDPLTRIARARSAHSPQCTISRVKWIHIPKCGTSLFTSLVRCACPGVADKDLPHSKSRDPGEVWDRDWQDAHDVFEVCPPQSWATWERNHPIRSHRYIGNHMPLWSLGCDDTPPGAPTVVTFLRDPRQRLRSAYHHNLHADGLGEELHAVLESEVSSLREFARYKGIGGCQVRMLLGWRCSDQEHIMTEAHVRAAIAVLRDNVAFFGLTGYWNLSMRLFYLTFGGEVWDGAVKNERVGKYNSAAKAAESLAPDDDPMDWMLYTQGAVPLFVERLRAAGVPDDDIPDDLLDMARSATAASL